MIHLTGDSQLDNGGHIVYIYNDIEAYIDNAIAFIRTGLEQQHQIVFIEQSTMLERMQYNLFDRLTEAQLEQIHLVDAELLYGSQQAFDGTKVLRHFNDVVQPLVDKRVPLRSWGHVLWSNQEGIEEVLERFEEEVDEALNPLGIVTVCAYHGKQISAALMASLMHRHEYLMTDTEFTKSPLYLKQGTKTVVPSLSVQTQIQSKMDLYKQKLDFIHVISHEVRNPLTVIKAYATMLLQDATALTAEARSRIQSISDYADVIDHEMTDIIHTEQMLSSDEVWQMEVTNPRPHIQAVINFMRIKARLQNIFLQSIVQMDGSEQIRCNVIGFKLVTSNILSNAIKYSEERGKVSIRIHTHDTALVIEVEDEGIGMTEHQLAHLFQKYGKMNQDHDGQGIGLYMVKTLVNHFGGSIQIASKLHEGTCVTIHLPLYQEGGE